MARRRRSNTVAATATAPRAAAGPLELLTIAEVAVRWKMDYETIRLWCKKGAIRCLRVGAGVRGHIRIALREVQRHEREKQAG